MVNIIIDAARKPTSMWKVVEALEEYNDCCSKASVQNKAQHIVVTRRGEDVPGIVADYGFPRAYDDDLCPFLGVFLRPWQFYVATIVDSKGPEHMVVKSIARCVKDCG